MSANARKPVEFRGACDASAAMLIGDRHLLVADDEGKPLTILRVYDIVNGGMPLQELDVTPMLKPEQDDPEVDAEGLAVGHDGRVYLIGSHSRKGDDAKPAPSRRRLLAFTLKGEPGSLQAHPVGLYTRLVEDAQTQLDGLLLDPDKPAKAGGLSIEGLTATATPGELLIGLRSPLVGQKALLIRMRNAAAVLESNQPPRLLKILLDLDGAGVRAIEYSASLNRYFLLAGPPGTGGPFHLFEWAGDDSPARKLRDIPAPDGTSAEALVLNPSGRSAWILFDEGERKTASGKECKSGKVKPADKSFRGIQIDF